MAGGELVDARDRGVLQHRAHDVAEDVEVGVGLRQALAQERLHHRERRILLGPDRRGQLVAGAAEHAGDRHHAVGELVDEPP